MTTAKCIIGQTLSTIVLTGFIFVIGMFAGVHFMEHKLKTSKVECEVIEYKSNADRVTVVRVGTVLKLAEKLNF